MEPRPLPCLAELWAYEQQAEELLAAHRSADPPALALIHRCHPRFLDEKVPWLPRRLTAEAIAAVPFDRDDARLVVARGYDFLDWAALAAHVAAVTRRGSPTFLFETAVEAVVDGDVAALRGALGTHPELVRARSTRRTHFDPPVHEATLLHYVAANGVEGHRQRTPPSAVEVTTLLLDAGAEVDALAGFYGGRWATLSLLVSSSHPAAAGLQVALAHLLLDRGAAIEGTGPEAQTPLLTALVFGYLDTAMALAQRGARTDTLEAAAGLGEAARVTSLLTDSDAEARHRALALAAQLGHADAVAALLDAGEDPDRYNPEGFHAHATPLHHAALAGHDAVVRLLVQRGARLDQRDTLYAATPLGWARYQGRRETAEYLAACGAPD